MCLHTSGRTRTSQHIAYVSNIRQHTSAYVRIYVPSYVRADQNKSAYSIRQHIRQHTSAYVSIYMPYTSAYVSIRQHMYAFGLVKLGLLLVRFSRLILGPVKEGLHLFFFP